jgi:hypothetical protein
MSVIEVTGACITEARFPITSKFRVSDGAPLYRPRSASSAAATEAGRRSATNLFASRGLLASLEFLVVLLCPAQNGSGWVAVSHSFALQSPIKSKAPLAGANTNSGPKNKKTNLAARFPALSLLCCCGGLENLNYWSPSNTLLTAVWNDFVWKWCLSLSLISRFANMFINLGTNSWSVTCVRQEKYYSRLNKFSLHFYSLFERKFIKRPRRTTIFTHYCQLLIRFNFAFGMI